MDERSYVKDLRKTPKKLELVRMRGLEPPHLAAPEPKSGVSTNSTTSATASIIGIHAFNVTYSFSVSLIINSKEFNLSLNSIKD